MKFTYQVLPRLLWFCNFYICFSSNAYVNSFTILIFILWNRNNKVSKWKSKIKFIWLTNELFASLFPSDEILVRILDSRLALTNYYDLFIQSAGKRQHTVINSEKNFLDGPISTLQLKQGVIGLDTLLKLSSNAMSKI